MQALGFRCVTEEISKISGRKNLRARSGVPSLGSTRAITLNRHHKLTFHCQQRKKVY